MSTFESSSSSRFGFVSAQVAASKVAPAAGLRKTHNNNKNSKNLTLSPVYRSQPYFDASASADSDEEEEHIRVALIPVLDEEALEATSELNISIECGIIDMVKDFIRRTMKALSNNDSAEINNIRSFFLIFALFVLVVFFGGVTASSSPSSTSATSLNSHHIFQNEAILAPSGRPLRFPAAAAPSPRATPLSNVDATWYPDSLPVAPSSNSKYAYKSSRAASVHGPSEVEPEVAVQLEAAPAPVEAPSRTLSAKFYLLYRSAVEEDDGLKKRHDDNLGELFHGVRHAPVESFPSSPSLEKKHSGVRLLSV